MTYARRTQTAGGCHHDGHVTANGGAALHGAGLSAGEDAAPDHHLRLGEPDGLRAGRPRRVNRQHRHSEAAMREQGSRLVARSRGRRKSSSLTCAHSGAGIMMRRRAANLA